ncbi:MAG: NADP-dependent oxidoreductase [Candidatus Methylomirabilia bacterium]
MAGKSNRQVVLRSRPVGWPKASDFELVERPVPTPGLGEMLIRTIWLSLDPAMRGWVSEAKNYSEPVRLGTVMRGFTVGEIVASNHLDYAVGEIVTSASGWQEYAVSDGKDIVRKVDPAVAPISTALGPLGHTGMTAYIGLLDIGQPKPGETVVVSTAAGAVGSVAGQIAKIKDCRAVGTAGSDGKVDLCLKEFGYDACINYKTSPDIGAALRQACPNGIDVYFDNVGGAILDAVLDQLNVGARIVICGTIGADASPTGPRVERRLLVARARMQAFVILDYFDRFPQGIRQLAEWMGAGRLRYREDIVDGLEKAPETLVRLLEGGNLGKQLVRVGAAPA